jgi:hypothetical protein
MTTPVHSPSEAAARPSKAATLATATGHVQTSIHLHALHRPSDSNTRRAAMTGGQCTGGVSTMRVGALPVRDVNLLPLAVHDAANLSCRGRWSVDAGQGKACRGRWRILIASREWNRPR